ncbi:MAG: CvpA family protein [Candidatus Omnitrophota bacterium]|nr:CvpA family protein [Candidatus Omnitrophota bacterium]MBU1928776.1 CvpA family protein [Candidatus Omnitrophota bacterium]MBU2034231.1 CvpA family protein [Candidatus Omnitrophota bacterium]MBU2258274.1 CvpA family protein [Candidatus Omnitrophota bacterium]
MILDIIKGFNWLDIVIVILIFRIIYVSIRTGIPVELFKLLGTLSAVYLSLHYYTTLSDFLKNLVPAIKIIPLDFLDFISFVALVLLGYIIFVFLREGFSRFIKMEAAQKLNKFGGFVLGIIRSCLVIGLLVFIIAISTISYLKDSVKSSYLGNRFLKVAPAVYTALWNGIMSKFVPGEKFNDIILEIKNKFK